MGFQPVSGQELSFQSSRRRFRVWLIVRNVPFFLLYSGPGGLTVLSQLLGCIFVFLTAAAPSRHSLGATYGLSQTTAAIARIIAPSLSTSLFAFSLERNLLGGYAVYAVFSFLSCFAVWTAMSLPHDVRPPWEGEEESSRRDD